MHHENIWKWLDNVEEDYLDRLDQWGVPPPRHPPQEIPPRSDTVFDGIEGETYQQYNTKCNAEAARLLGSLPPEGILLRNGSIRITGKSPKISANDVRNANHPQSLLPGFPTNSAHDGDNYDRSQSLVPGFAASPEATSQRTIAPFTRQLQTSGREGNSDSANPKRLPNFPERARVRGLSEALRSTSIIHSEDQDPVAVKCQGARVVGGHQRNGPQCCPSTKKKSRRNTTAEEGALHRSNAIREPSNVRVELKARPKY